MGDEWRKYRYKEMEMLVYQEKAASLENIYGGLFGSVSFIRWWWEKAGRGGSMIKFGK